jgi:hypothetical protein
MKKNRIELDSIRNIIKESHPRDGKRDDNPLPTNILI